MTSQGKDEPATTAKVILFTTHGQLDIEIWSRETPLASRNFIQLCLQGYYNNTIFHRMIPGFMVQGGDPTGTGNGGQSVYGGTFKDELHQRLKFNRRGMVAMANAGRNTNSSQFFITFAECQHLNKKHTIFGKIVGDTIFNLLSMQSLDTDDKDRPVDPPYIRKVKVVLNPFDDIKPRTSPQTLEIKKQVVEDVKEEARKKKEEIKKLKQKNKLTFELDEDQSNYKMQSSHDVLSDRQLSTKLALTPQEMQNKKQQKQDYQAKIQQLKDKIHKANDNSYNGLSEILQTQIQKKRKLNNLSNNSTPQDQILNYKKRINPQTNKVQIFWEDKIPEQPQQESQSSQILDQKLRQVRQLQLKQYELLKADELNFKKAKEGSAKLKKKQIINQQLALLSNVEKRRYQFIKKTKMSANETQLFTKLNNFVDKINKNNPNDWMCHKLKFHIDSQNAYRLGQNNKVREGRQDYIDDGGLEMQDGGLDKRDGFDIDQLYQLTKNNHEKL